MRSTCFFALILVLLPLPVLSQEPSVAQARNPVWLEPCPEADSSDVEVLKARVDCLERRSEAMADSLNLLLQNMLMLLEKQFLLLEEQFLNEPAKIVERIPAVAEEAILVRGINAVSDMPMNGVPTVVNCVPPLRIKSGFVLIGAKLSNWTNQHSQAASSPPWWSSWWPQCFGASEPENRAGIPTHHYLHYMRSRSRSEGCYVNRTWFDWYTRRAATEGWPTDEATLCRESAESGEKK